MCDTQYQMCVSCVSGVWTNQITKLDSVFYLTTLYCIAGMFSRRGLVNHQQFAKLKLSKLVVTINNLLANLFISQTFFTKVSIHPLPSSIFAIILSRYTVTISICLPTAMVFGWWYVFSILQYVNQSQCMYGNMA